MTCTDHGVHPHVHGPGCGHQQITHGDHTDYLHDGHLHSPHGSHNDEHHLDVNRRLPAACAPLDCPERHHEGRDPAVPHGDHVDYEVDGTLHHPHEDHCDLHGRI